MKETNNKLTKAESSLEKFQKFIGLNPDTFKGELRELLRTKPNTAAIFKAIMIVIGVVFLPITVVGLLIGYARGYKRFMFVNGEFPRVLNLPFIVKVAMAIGVLIAWAVFLTTLGLIYQLGKTNLFTFKAVLSYIAVNTILSLLAYSLFRKWSIGIHNMLIQRDQHGTARWANDEDIAAHVNRPGLHIGGPLTLADKGHCITGAGARAGKTVNLLVNAILGVGGYTGSFFVIDPKGELAAICSRGLREMGKNVVILNPWQLLPDYISGDDTYNPLDLLSDRNSPHLIDDVSILTEMILAPKQGDHNSFFTDSARNVLSSLLLHLVCSDQYPNPTLTDLWKMCRATPDRFDEILADMATSTHPVNGEAIRQAANEILKQQGSPETWCSILSNALEATNFLKSGAVQNSLVSGFDPYSLADGNTVVFFTIPADKLRSQSSLLRLVTVSMMRAVVRKPTVHKVTFLVDEAAFLGPVSEFPIAYAAYAGFNICMWLIFQDLPQIHALYGDMWESLLSNAAVKQFFGCKDNMTCKYISDMLGTKTDTVYERDWMGNISNVQNTKRELLTPDEVRVVSKDEMIIFTGENPAARIKKLPYYANPELFKNGKPIFDPNPYIEGSK